MNSLLAEIIGTLLQGAIPSRRPSAPPPEGEVNASLGAIAGFFGFLSVLFSLALLGMLKNGLLFLTTFACIPIGFGYIAYRAGRRAPRVSDRNLRLAKLGFGASIVGFAVTGASLLIAVGRILF